MKICKRLVIFFSYQPDYELLGNSSQENVEQIHTLQNPEMVNRQVSLVNPCADNFFINHGDQRLFAI